MSEIIKFSFNWNDKLNTRTFTTIRKHDHFEEGKIYSIFLKENYLFEAKIIVKKFILIESISTSRAYLETGYNRINTINIIKKMYPNVDWSKEHLIWLLLIKL